MMLTMLRLITRMALRALRHHTIRSALTLLGIVIGIAGIIVISAAGKGTEIKGPVAREAAERYSKISSAASIIV